MAPTVRTQRPSIPTLWIDTAIALDLALGRDDDRCRELQRLVLDLVRKRKLLCPSSEQWEEFDGTKVEREAFDVLQRLSVGVRLQHRGEIEDSLTYAAMKAYAARDDVIETSVETFFHGDPVEELEEALRQPFIISMTPFSAPEILDRRRSGKVGTHEKWEKLRRQLVADGATYDQRLPIELRGRIDFAVQALRDFARTMESGEVDFWTVMTGIGPSLNLRQWEAASGEPPGLPGLLRFFASEHYAALPTTRIPAQIIADITTDPGREIQASDSMDGQLLSIAIPISNFVVTDKSMAARIKRLGIDREWNTEVFSLSSIGSLFDRLRGL